jgi:hypothetical protein
LLALPHAGYRGDIIFTIDSRGGIYRWLNKDIGFGILFWYPVCGVIDMITGGLLGLYTHRLLSVK